MHRFKTPLALVTALTLAASAFAQTPEIPKTAEKGGQASEGAPIEQNPEFSAVGQRFQTDFGVTITLARADEAVTAKNYDVTTLKAEHLANALSVLAWVEAELKRYPAGFVKKHGAKNLVLANAYVSKAAKAAKSTTPAYSPTFIAERAGDSILVTVPGTMTPTIEVLGRGYLHYTLFSYLLADVKSPDSPLAPAHWKTLESDDATRETESDKRLTKASNGREGLYKMLWEPFEFGELTTLAKTDAKLKQRIEIVQSYLRTLEPRFDDAFWKTLAIIPEHQRTICLNDPIDPHSADQIKADAEIQDDIRMLEKQWGFKVLWEPGSPVPPMPAKVRLEYSYFTDKKLHEFKEFIRMVREELEIYPEQITKRLQVKNLYILNDFTFRGSGVAGQGMSWLPQVSFAYGLRTFDPAKVTSRDFYRRTIHHEVLHLIDKEFSKEGGPIFGANWDSLNEKGFAYKIGRINALTGNAPGSPNAPNQTTFYKDNTKWQGFAEPYGMNIATDDRATLFGRMMTARVADEGRGDQPFLAKLQTDKILKAKFDRMIEFFQFLKRDLAIPSPNPFDSKLEGILPPQKAN
ncbi:MAG: hypothetical protein ACKVY0_03845 [Prosthecobacter sp.]|uniref:hypothetical protein n=1 Tax=Prosthecobacter sp. TaxID=1965333 RepID=UPI0038FE4FBB